MASGTAHTLLLHYLPLPLPLPVAALLFYSFHRVHAVARPFMPHDQQQFVYEYLINPQLTHQWTQPIGALRPDAPHRDWAGCAIQPSIHPSIHPPSILSSILAQFEMLESEGECEGECECPRFQCSCSCGCDWRMQNELNAFALGAREASRLSNTLLFDSINVFSFYSYIVLIDNV